MEAGEDLLRGLEGTIGTPVEGHRLVVTPAPAHFSGRIAPQGLPSRFSLDRVIDTRLGAELELQVVYQLLSAACNHKETRAHVVPSQLTPVTVGDLERITTKCYLGVKQGTRNLVTQIRNLPGKIIVNVTSDLPSCSKAHYLQFKHELLNYSNCTTADTC